MSLAEVFRNQLRHFRELSSLSQRKLSLLVGKKTTFIQQLESGSRHPTMEMLPVIAQALGVPVLALLSQDTFGVSPEFADVVTNRPILQELVLAANSLDDQGLRQLIGIAKTLKSTPSSH